MDIANILTYLRPGEVWSLDGAFFVVAFFAVLFAAALRLLLVFVMAMESSSKKEARNPVGKAARLALQPSQCAGLRRAH